MSPVKPGDEPKPLPNVFPDNLKEAYGNAIKYFKSDSKWIDSSKSVAHCFNVLK